MKISLAVMYTCVAIFDGILSGVSFRDGDVTGGAIWAFCTIMFTACAILWWIMARNDY